MNTEISVSQWPYSVVYQRFAAGVKLPILSIAGVLLADFAMAKFDKGRHTHFPQ